MAETLTTEAPATGAAISSPSTGAADTSLVDSSRDLLTDLPSDLFDGLDSDAGGEDDGDSAGLDEPGEIETPDPDPDPDEDEQGEEEDQTEEQDGKEPASKDGDKPEDEGKTEELPEGVVRGKDRHGKPGLFVEEPRWKNIYQNHQLVQRLAEAMGEPADYDALELRVRAYDAQEKLFSDLVSGDPKAQGAVLSEFFSEMRQAKERGAVPVDPSVPMAQTFYDTIKQQSESGYHQLRYSAARDLLTEMYSVAADSGDKDLAVSAQHIGAALAGIKTAGMSRDQIKQAVREMGFPFHGPEELAQLKPRETTSRVDRLQAENEDLRQRLNGQSGTSVAAQFDNWFTQTNQAVRATVLDDAVKPALASVEQSWKQFPNDFKELVLDRLHRKVQDVIRGDKAFEERIDRLKTDAARATSAQVRKELGEQIVRLFRHRAERAVEFNKKEVLDFAARNLKQRVDKSHDRRQASQNRTAPNGTSKAVPRSIAPKNLNADFKDGVYDSNTAYRQALEVIRG